MRRRFSVQDAERVLNELGVAQRSPERRGPFPSDPATFAQVVQMALPIQDAFWVLDDAASTGAGVPYVAVDPLVRFLTATRPWGDLHPEELGVTDEDQEHFILPLALALALVWKLHGDALPRVKQKAEGLGWSMEEVKTHFVQQAVLLAQLDRMGRQTVRLGQAWVKGTDGRKTTVSPAQELPTADFMRWFRSRALSLAAEVGGLTEGDEKRMVHLDEDHPDPVAGPLDALEAATAALHPLRSLDRVRAEATPKQRSVLDALVEAMRGGASLPEAKRVVATELKVQVNAVDLHLSRLRSRLAG